MRRMRARGATGLLLLVILALAVTALLAAYAVNRLSSKSDDQAETQRRLAVAADALERIAGVHARLPCPSDPSAAPGAAADGVESQATVATCTFDGGTIPWKTIGMKSDDAVDAWGRKLSYRVYDGGNGSLTQPSGVSMVECDTVEPTAGNATTLSNSQGALCVSSPDPYQRTTTPANFLNGKGLQLTDYGVAHNDTAYVVISHGATGYGGYTLAGTQMPAPNSNAEKNNARNTGPFTIQAFSGSDIGVTSGQHFDDLLVYRTLPDLVQRIGLGARDWPETVTTTATFDTATVSAALGHAAVVGDLGTATINFPAGVVATGFSGSAVSTNIAFDTASGNTTTGLGIAGNASNLMSSVGGEYIKLKFASPAMKFAVTLNDFGFYTSGFNVFFEQAQFTFTLGGNAVGSAVVKAGCRADGDLASFSITPSSTFDGVQIQPLSAVGVFGGTNTSSFLVSSVKACDVTVSSCTTALTNGGNTCP